MTQSLATRAVSDESDEEREIDGRDVEQSRESVSLALVSAPSAAPPRPTHFAGLGRSASNRREVALVLGLSALLHAGVAAAAIRSASKSTHTPKPLSQVQVEVSRPPQRLTPPPPAPPPPPVAKPQVKPVAAQPREPVPQLAPSPSPLPETPVDTGSSAPAAEDGELYAGSGGLGTAPPAPPPPPAPKVDEPAAPEPIVQAREGANYLKNPRPGYPSVARRQGWEGTTTLRVQVGENGRARAIQIQRSSGRDVLDEAATDAVKSWTFAPATQGGRPVTGWVTVPIVFKLQ